MKGFVEKHPLPAYFALTYAISWGGFILVVGPGGFPGAGSQFDRLTPRVAAAMLAGPSIAGILLTILASGWPGLRGLMARLVEWRVGARWYAVALLVAPLVAAAALLGLSLTSPIFTAENKAAILLTGLTAGMTTVLEEVGWTGFAVPRLRARHGVLATGLIVGVLWGAWHLLQGLWVGGTYAGTLPLGLFIPLSFLSGVAQLTAYRVLMVWVYDRTESLLVATLMHASLTASVVFVFTPVATGVASLTYGWVLALALWAVVAAVALASGGHLSRAATGVERGHPPAHAASGANPHGTHRQPRWQRVILLCVLGYEGAGALSGGGLLVAAPDGRLMDMPVHMMHGVFRDFLVPGLILTALGVLESVAFVAVWRRTRTDWLLAGLALVGLAIWFIVEIVVLRQLHWLHVMWGLPVLAGILAALPLIPSRRSARSPS